MGTQMKNDRPITHPKGSGIFLWIFKDFLDYENFRDFFLGIFPNKKCRGFIWDFFLINSVRDFFVHLGNLCVLISPVWQHAKQNSGFCCDFFLINSVGDFFRVISLQL